MLEIPKNVMQIGEINAHTKIYMEDYVHTFLERRKDAEEYLAFGKKEERSDTTIYLIYGVERKTDWNRGTFPYFKRYERIGTIEGAAGKRVLRPVRGAGIALTGYFVFYEQNEDMQSYMIVVREAEAAGGSEEKEEVLEAVRTKREKHIREAAEHPEMPVYQRDAEGSSMKPPVSKPRDRERSKRYGQAFQRLRKKAWEGAAKTQERKKRERTVVPVRQEKEPRSFSIPDLCRSGSMVLLLILVVLGITSLNRYPDMKAVVQMVSDAARAVGKDTTKGASAEEETQQNRLVIEETTPQIQWTIGQNTAGEQSPAETELPGAEETPAGEDALGLLLEDEPVSGAMQEDKTISEAPREGEPAADAGQEAEREDEPAGKALQEDALATKATAQGQREEPAAENDQKPENASAESMPGTVAEQEEAAEETTQAIAHPVTYVVKKGDNLAEIVRRFYGNTSRIKEICAVNDIEDPDQIHAGQNILLP